ncbi:MAG: hypothetical protein ACYCXW_09595 [Solirubrobacteraceae bacterium]
MAKLRFVLRRLGMLGAVIASLAAVMAVAAASASAATAPAARGELDCNGHSPIQQSIKLTLACTDIRGFNNEWNANTWGGRFYDNGNYIGHDEPDITYLSSKEGSGNNVSYTTTLPRDPSAAPTARNPGHDVAHTFQLTPAFWYSMAICDSNSYPQANCTPRSDSNAPTCVGANFTGCSSGGGSAVLELQLYPPGEPPFVNSISCDNSHWCAALTIDSLECTAGFVNCNTGCEEPVNFGWIQRDGVPTGPPSPQLADLSTFTPNGETLLMAPGDRITVHIFDAALTGGGYALETAIHDWNTGQTGYMQASATNGFANTSMTNCSGTPYNFQPEYSTASPSNTIPWAAVSTNVGTAVETGHWVSCTSLDSTGNLCLGPYEQGGADSATGPEGGSDAPCFTAGTGPTAPTATGCLDFNAGGDLDFDGSPYWPEWPVASFPTAKLPGSFVVGLPTSDGSQYPQYYLQTDTALSETTCANDPTSQTACAVPPPGAPGNFYPYWSRVSSFFGCAVEFGNVRYGPGVNSMGGDAQYGTNQFTTLGYPEIIGPVQNNSCGGFDHHQRH